MSRMSSKTNNMSNTLLIAIVVILCIIFMANSWVSNEIEETKKITTPAIPTVQTTRLNNALRNNSHANDESDETDYEAETGSKGEINSSVPKKKRQKIIYEIPLDDVNLVQ